MMHLSSFSTNLRKDLHKAEYRICVCYSMMPCLATQKYSTRLT